MHHQTKPQSTWLRSYYYARAGFSIFWVIAATSAASLSPVASLLLVIYPAWDALANLVDARAHGGLAANRSQMLNVFASSVMQTRTLFWQPSASGRSCPDFFSSTPASGAGGQLERSGR